MFLSPTLTHINLGLQNSIVMITYYVVPYINNDNFFHSL